MGFKKESDRKKGDSLLHGRKDLLQAVCENRGINVRVKERNKGCIDTHALLQLAN